MTDERKPQRWAITGGDTISAEDRAHLNEAQPEVYCERCGKVHPARPAGEFDRTISKSAQALSDDIDRRALEYFKKRYQS